MKKKTTDEMYPPNTDDGVQRRVRHIIRTPEGTDVIAHATKIMKILERYKAKDIREIMKEKNDIEWVEWLDRFDRKGEKIVMDKLYPNTDAGFLRRVRYILRTPEVGNVVKHANKIMKILGRYKAKDARKIFEHRNDEEWLEHFNRETPQNMEKGE